MVKAHDRPFDLNIIQLSGENAVRYLQDRPFQCYQILSYGRLRRSAGLFQPGVKIVQATKDMAMWAMVFSALHIEYQWVA